MADSYVTLTVHGIESEDEVESFKDELQEVKGIQIVDINSESDEVEVGYGEELLSEEQIKSQVREMGYEAE